jgi:hypothetical protein
MSDDRPQRLFIQAAPSQVVQNLITALDPELLTEHTILLLLNDLTKMLPIDELPRRLVEVFSDYLQEIDENEQTAANTH